MPPPTEVAGRYEILAEPGRGMIRAVYRAYDRALGRDVALKVSRCAAEGADGQGYEQRFLNETRAAARLSHTAIVVVTTWAGARRRGPCSWPSSSCGAGRSRRSSPSVGPCPGRRR